MNDKRICIIYTGGTIGMVDTGNGYEPENGALGRELAGMRDLTADGMPEWDLIEFSELLDSSNMTYNEWNLIGRAVYDNYDEYDGFVVLHGTDTMAYSASALSFMLPGLDKPVVFTGSQIPLCEIRSDGKDNLITAMMIAADGMAREVTLYFGNKLIRGNRATKTSADGLIAFESPNYPELAKAGVDIVYNRSASDDIYPDAERKPGNAGKKRLELIEYKKVEIGVIKLFPGIHFELFAPIVTERLDGLVLETFGTGNIPNYDDSLPPLIERAIKNGTTVTVLTQCQQGTVRLGAYQTSRALARAGAVSGYNMTTEAAVTKLAHLVSAGHDAEEVRSLMEQDMRGELTK